jgi:quercetin dioxygenase-like cupin family protein
MKVTYGKGFAVGLTQRQKVDRLEAEIMQLPQIECEITHHFAPGMYARRAYLKAGAVYTGAIHKTEHLIMLAKGRVEIVTQDGTATFEAGDIITCKPGMKNAVYALEDSVWANYFPTMETNPEKLVEVLTESKACMLLGGSQNVQAIHNAMKGELWLS